MSSQQTSCASGTCDCYQRGLADARRTVEAELAAERAAIAVLAASLMDAADDISIYVNQQDAACFGALDDLPIEIDPAMVRGAVRVADRTGTLPRAF